jgi:hypothetical protein
MKKKTKQPKSARYFFLNDIPHKKLQVNRAADMLIAWNYIEHKRVAYVWSVAKRNMERAFLGPEIQKMLGRHRNSLYMYVRDGNIQAPFKTYSLDGTERPGMYLWTEKQVLDLHDYILSIGYGRTTKSGLPRLMQLPSRTELLAMMRNDVVLYTKTKDGKYTPVWQEKDW